MTVESKNETVIILHGIARTSCSMAPVERALRKAGYKTMNITYPSRKNNLDGIASYLLENFLKPDFFADAEKIHFVTHSMGGLVARTFLEKYKNKIDKNKLGRVVMLAPPNSGSEVADLLHRFKVYKMFYGPAGQELTTVAQKENKIVPYYDVGIIAGTTAWPYFLGKIIIHGRSDGRVSVEKTKMNGMKDFIDLPAGHSFIMYKTAVHKQIIRFLNNGEFKHEK